jgi:integrase
MVEAIKIHQRCLSARLHHLTSWRVPPSVVADVRRFIEELALGKVNRGRQISEARRVKYLDLLRLPLQFLNKAASRITALDIESFDRALSTDKVQSGLKGTPYSHATKADIRKALKVFLRWRVGTAKAHDLAGWLDTRHRFKTPDYLKEIEVERLIRKCRSAEQRFIIAVLFDSGARAEEFLNIRLEDVQLPEGRSNFPKLALREEFSKTKGRTISLYWRYSSDAVRDYVHERLAEGIKPADPLFARSYDSLRMFVKRLARLTLKRDATPHLFRHSSATHYASKLNRQELCYRYGWKFSSNMPDIYISRAGMENKQLDEKFTQTELGAVKDELAKLQYETKLKDETILQLRRQMAGVQNNIQEIFEVLARKPTEGELVAALERKRLRPVSIQVN